MPGIGGLSIATNLLANSVTLNLNRNQAALQNVVTQLSSGLRINSAADDPSGLAIATRLNAQAQGTDVGSLNVQDANNAATIAAGALQTETAILQRIRSLSVEASNDLTSDTDKLSLQAEVSQLLTEVNRISQNTNFNGQTLLNGSHSGFTPQVNFNAITYSNAVLSASSGTAGQTNFLVSGLSFVITNNTSVDGTLQLQVVQLSAASQGIIFTFLSSASGTAQVVSTATLAGTGAALTFTYDGVAVTTGTAITTADVGSTSYVKITQFVSSAVNLSSPAFSIHDGPSEGAVIVMGIQATNTQTLRLSNINLAGSIGTTSPSLAAEDAIGQVDNALNQILSQSALLGAVVNRLNQDLDNNNIASVNLTAAASQITDLNVGQATTEFTKLNILIQVGSSVLAQANVNAQTVLTLFR